MILMDMWKETAKNYIFVKNLKTCLAVLSYVGYIMAKARGPNVNNGLDTSQNKAVDLAGVNTLG
jgi:hypothetical protein